VEVILDGGLGHIIKNKNPVGGLKSKGGVVQHPFSNIGFITTVHGKKDGQGFQWFFKFIGRRRHSKEINKIIRGVFFFLKKKEIN
jgi:hypothetical protein